MKNQTAADVLDELLAEYPVNPPIPGKWEPKKTNADLKSEVLKQLYELCVAALPEKMGDKDKYRHSDDQMESHNQAIDQSIEALKEIFNV